MDIFRFIVQSGNIENMTIYGIDELEMPLQCKITNFRAIFSLKQVQNKVSLTILKNIVYRYYE